MTSPSLRAHELPLHLLNLVQEARASLRESLSMLSMAIPLLQSRYVSLLDFPVRFICPRVELLNWTKLFTVKTYLTILKTNEATRLDLVFVFAVFAPILACRSLLWRSWIGIRCTLLSLLSLMYSLLYPLLSSSYYLSKSKSVVRCFMLSPSPVLVQIYKLVFSLSKRFGYTSWIYNA